MTSSGIAEADYTRALGELRSQVAGFRPGNQIYDAIVSSRDQVLGRYGPAFALPHLAQLSKEEFTSFLYLDNNKHWSGLYRKGLAAASDMDRLRAALRLLLDEGQALSSRFTSATNMISGFGKALATAILTVAHPSRYGVWNNTSEGALRKLGLWPAFERGDSAGTRYERVNSVLLRVSADLGLDLWTLDAIWWRILGASEPTPSAESATESAGPLAAGAFALEKHLEEFLLENWDRTELGKEWAIYSTDDDPDAGNQFPTDVGPIDILAKHRTAPRWLVVELKRHQGSDQTVGQALRYLGWVKVNLAKPTDSVEALIIAQSAGKDVQYALSTVPNVSLMLYEVSFSLRSPQ